jgi:hypothetical protein
MSLACPHESSRGLWNSGPFLPTSVSGVLARCQAPPALKPNEIVTAQGFLSGVSHSTLYSVCHTHSVIELILTSLWLGRTQRSRLYKELFSAVLSPQFLHHRRTTTPSLEDYYISQCSPKLLSSSSRLLPLRPPQRPSRAARPRRREHSSTLLPVL